MSGLYFPDNDVVQIAKQIEPSLHGELEIISVYQVYLDRGDLNVEVLNQGFAWLDTGTVISLLEAVMFVETLEKRQGFRIVCLVKLAFYNG